MWAENETGNPGDGFELKRGAYRMKYEAKYFKTTLIDLARQRLAAGQKYQASGIF